MLLWWGPDLCVLYNDAYIPIFAQKHPTVLGRTGREAWGEVWDLIGPMFEGVMNGGDATWSSDQLLVLTRKGFVEETYLTWSYSPILVEDGTVGGVFTAVIETTERVLSERRLVTLRALSEQAADAKDAPAACARAAATLGENQTDVPFALIYLLDDASDRAVLAGQAGLDSGGDAAPQVVSLSSRHAIWPLREAATSAVPIVVNHDDARALPLVAGPWPEPCSRAVILPIARAGETGPYGLLIAGLSTRLEYNDSYRSFLNLVASHIASAVGNAHAYDEERRRAEALAELDRAKTTFFSNVSHEFRTPLTLILGPLADARRAADTLPAEVRTQLDVVHRNSLRLLKLVNTMLDFTRIEAGRVRARFEAVDLCALTTDLASTFRSAMDKAGLVFEAQCEPLPTPVYVDRDMWEQIVLNLISNAFKFTLQGRITVSVFADGDGRAVLAVEDTGTGIPEQELPHVFERFHRVEGTVGRSHEGSGIGLALVQELVKLHGGELAVTSRLGQGSRFVVSIPLGKGHLPPEHIVADGIAVTPSGAAPYVEEALRWLPAAAQDENVSAAAGTITPASEVGRVLLADDNADMREYATRLMAERWEVRAVTNGRQAFETARVWQPDVIVTDVMMPELDGFGLLRELRADPDLRATPVIMLSARAGEEARLEGLSASADDYIVKPFSARDLLTRVDAQLVKSRARASERHYVRRVTNLFANAPVAIAVLRGAGHVHEFANAHYTALVGGRDVVGKTVQEAFPELADQGIYELLDQVRSSGQPFVGRSMPVRLKRGPGETLQELYLDFVYQPIVSDNGDVEGIVVVAHDVTTLVTAKQEAETANRLKDEFLATLSHELRTPLNAVLGYTQMVRGGVIEPQRLPAVLATIERNAKLQEQLISDVLDVSRIITGKLRLDVRPVDLTRVIQDAIETVTPAATAKGVRLQSTIDQPGVPVAGDAQRLQQVVWNLLSNAVKFTPRGGRVQVRLERVNSHVEITVSDTGQGVAPEFLPDLFQRFRQEDGGFTREHGGLGLGLAISRHLVEAHGGGIEATSPGKGHGTTVRIELPLMIVHDGKSEASDRVHPTVEENAPTEFRLANLKGIRVLLVDDDEDAVQMAGDALAAAGAEVELASSAATALDALDRGRFDAAVIDIGMPETDGYGLLSRIRRRSPERHGEIPTAALTAYARGVDRTRALEAGFQMHLAKPIQPTELAAAVLALAGSKRRSTP